MTIQSDATVFGDERSASDLAPKCSRASSCRPCGYGPAVSAGVRPQSRLSCRGAVAVLESGEGWSVEFAGKG